MDSGRNRRDEMVGKVHDDVDASEDEDDTAGISGTDHERRVAHLAVIHFYRLIVFTES